MAKRIPTPFKYRGKWRASVTLAGGQRRVRDFDKHQEAKSWILQMLAEVAESAGHEAKLGGPTQATLADALHYYALHWTVNKGGAHAELNRINHYLASAGQQRLRLQVDAEGRKSVVSVKGHALPKAFAAHNDQRRGLRDGTYQAIERLAQRRCSAISTADLRELMSTMTREGLSESTIQKEIALLRHVFNTASKEWGWLGFKNPCEGLKLGKSATRFVVLTSAQVEKLMQAAASCDNPLVATAIGLALDTAMRKGSLLALDWANINLENRTLQVSSKTGDVVLALSQTSMAILQNLPRKTEGRVLPMTDNALDMAWEGVREKAGLPKLQFRDLRHVAATRLAKQGMSAHQLQRVLGHKTIAMALVYINMVQSDMADVLDKLAPLNPVLVAEPAGDMKDVIRQRRSDRITGAIRDKAQARYDELTTSQVPAPVAPQDSSDAPPVAEFAETTPAAPSGPARVSTSTGAVISPDTTPVGALKSNVLMVDFRARKASNG